MPVKYNPSRGYLRTLLKLSNTAVPSVLARYEFWLLFNLHLLVGCAYRFGYVGDLMVINWNEMKVIAAITTFFEVFYTNHCYHRYLHFYSVTRLMLGNMYDYCFELRLHLNQTCKQHLRLAVRQLVASVLLFFYEMDDVSEVEWDELVHQGLVRSQERHFLQKFASKQHSLIMLQWSAEAARDGCAESKAPANVMKSLMACLVECRSLQQEVVDQINLPMPFQYVHLLKSMLLVNMVCWAWGMALTMSMFAPFVFWVSLLIFMGMMELASQLADPFGDDDVDFPVTEWLDDFVESTVVLMEFRNPPDHLSRALQSEQPLVWKPPGLQLFMNDQDLASEFCLCSADSNELPPSSPGEEILKPLMSD